MRLHPTLRHFHGRLWRVAPIASLAIAVCLAGSSVAAPSGTARAAGKSFSARYATAPASLPVLVAIRASHHPRFDRVVFDFTGPLPARRTVRYVAHLIADPSGRTISVAGRAILQVTLAQAIAHNSAGRATAPARLAVALPNAMSVVRSGDFEGVVSYGIGLAQRASIHVMTLTRPSRVVIDIATPSRTVLKRVYFFNQRRFAANTPPFVTSVLRPVPSRTPATGLMDRLFAGPTPGETRTGLRLLSSGASGFAGLSISGSIARIRLTGGCSSGGSTATIAQEITPTLRQLPGVRFVKIYDPAGRTEHPTGARDSIPFCLEP